jgi:hypothetical protein
MHFHKLSFVGFLIFFVLKKQTDLYGLQYNTEPDVRETPSSVGSLTRNISKHMITLLLIELDDRNICHPFQSSFWIITRADKVKISKLCQDILLSVVPNFTEYASQRHRRKFLFFTFHVSFPCFLWKVAS